MKITLPHALEQFVQKSVKEGSYVSESEVMADALRRLIACQSSVARSNGLSELTSRSLFALGLSLGSLRGQLAEVEVQIKEVLKQIERTGQQENAEQDRIKKTQEALKSLIENLNKTANAYAELLKNIDLNA